MGIKVLHSRNLHWLLGAAWTLVLAVSFFTGKTQMEDQTVQVATAQANAHFDQDINIRKWAASHGGVYVPVSERTQPNPYLAHIADRDLELPSGKHLTLMNPAYIIRQLNEDQAARGGVLSKITSLKPIRPENGPDPWERQALTRLSTGETQVSGVETMGQEEYLRFMRPLNMEVSCLKCHSQQGYQVGDQRGGVGVAIPLSLLRSLDREALSRQLLIHLGLWVLGLVGIGTGNRLLARSRDEQEQLAARLQKALTDTDAIIDNVPVGIIMVGTDKIVRRINQSALKILGKREDEVVGHCCHQNICPAQVGQCPVVDLGLKIDNAERMALLPQGRTLPIIKTVIPFHYHGEDILLEAFIDTTDQAKRKEELLTTVDELQRFNRLAVGRELRMAELKSEVNSLLSEMERQPRYELQQTAAPGGGQ